jgi:hypothetical protein
MSPRHTSGDLKLVKSDSNAAFSFRDFDFSFDFVLTLPLVCAMSERKGWGWAGGVGREEAADALVLCAVYSQN